MCGIVGFYSRKRENNDLIESMVDKIAHRGPNDRGCWSENKITMGHSRLAIIDLTKAGKQPMISASGRYIISYNGEVYNFRDIKSDLVRLNYPFCSETDTEVLLAAIQVWGIEKALAMISGMYAFAVWDRKEQVLSLVRDRVGEKPLYYGFNEGSFIFSSELSPIKHFCKNLIIDKTSLNLFFRYGYIPCPYSIYKDIHKLQPGHFVQFSTRHLENSQFPTPKIYWNPDDHNQREDNFNLDRSIDKLDELITDSVSRQMVSDVPLGAFLSGGIDSSLVSAIMQRLSSRPINTFSIGFDIKDLDEAPYARDVAKQYRIKPFGDVYKWKDVFRCY